MASDGILRFRELSDTPTWAVAAVCAVLIIISHLLEKGLHIGKWFKKKSALGEALEKVVEAELVIMSFIFLLFVYFGKYVSKICIPKSAGNTMLPCQRLNSEIDESDSGCADGKRPLMSAQGINELALFICSLTVVHIVYSASVICLGRLKIRSWKQWEEETMSINYEFSTDPSIFGFTRDTSFVQQHASFGNRKIILIYFVSFFRQFIGSIRRTDYLTMRHCFIDVHLHPGIKFNFQKYIKRSLDHDFIEVVGISPILWACGVIIMLLNVYNSQELFWVTVLLLVLILAIGTKVQAIIATMTLQIQQRHAVIQGMPIVKLGDHHFWFGQPRLILFLIHLTLFVNAFQLTYFLWIWFEYGLNSCFHEKIGYVIARICIGITVHLLCSYITLPLYALVSQMGSHIKMSIFHENTSKALKRWRDAAKKRYNLRHSHSPCVAPSPSPGQNPMASPTSHHLYPYNTTRRSHSDNEFSDGQTDMAVASSHELSRNNVSHNVQLNIEVGRDRRDEDSFDDLLTGPYPHTPMPMPEDRPRKMHCFIDRDDGYQREMERLTNAVVMSTRHNEFDLTIDQVADLAGRTRLVSKTEVSVGILSRSRYLIHLPRGLATETFIQATPPSLWDEGYDFQPWDPLQDASITIPSFKVLVDLQDIPPQLYREKEVIIMVSAFGTYLGTVAQIEQADISSWLVAIATDDLSRIPHGIALIVGGLEFLVTVHPLKWTSGPIYTAGDLPKPPPKYSKPEEPL